MSKLTRTIAAHWHDYWDLTKPKVVALIVFTALVGMALAIPTLPTAAQWRAAVLGLLGIWLAASAAAAINQLLDARIDAQMARTSWRPLVVGKVQPWQVLVFAGVLIALSMAMLVAWVNVVTAVLTFASLIGYAVIYTVYLKRATSQNIVIGGLAGAMPPMLGWAAASRSSAFRPTSLSPARADSAFSVLSCWVSCFSRSRMTFASFSRLARTRRVSDWI